MSFVAAAVVTSAVVGASAAKGAAKTQASAADRASELSNEQFQQTREDQAGYRARGDAAGNRLALLLGLNSGVAGASSDPLYGSLNRVFTGNDLTNDPGYQFGLREGNRSIERSAAARGGLYSGATLKALQRYGADYGGTKFNEAFNRDQINKSTLYNQLAGVSGTGQVATQATSAAGAENAANRGAYGIGAANAGAASSLAQGNILQNSINQGVSMWQRSPTAGSAGQAWFSNTPLGGSGFGSGLAYGNQDLGQEFSDARLKKNIRPIGRTPRGNTIYTWDWKTGGSGQGVIAQEVQHIPGAVQEDADGLLMVDYSKV